LPQRLPVLEYLNERISCVRSHQVARPYCVAPVRLFALKRQFVDFHALSPLIRAAEPIIPADSAQETREAAEFKR
jgi:hypothetical protein